MLNASTLELAPGCVPYPGYRLVHLLGKGGCGEVWKAARVADGSNVAIKFLPCDSGRLAAQEIRALQAIRTLKHPNVLQVQQVWSCSGYLAVAMDLAEGSMLDLLDTYMADVKSPVAPDHLCYYLQQVALGLDFLNERRHLVDGERVAFRHCDIKPSNLLVFGHVVKVADFSLAMHTTSTSTSHRRVGTLHYAAPEVFQGIISDRTDQFSLAVTYVQLRTGRLPFPDEPQSDCKSKSYNKPAPDLRSLPPAERTILVRALDPVPQNRWPNCADMMNRISQVVQATPAARREPKSPQQVA